MVFGIHADSLYLLWLLLARAAFLWPERAALTAKTNAARDWKRACYYEGWASSRHFPRRDPACIGPASAAPTCPGCCTFGGNGLIS